MMSFDDLIDSMIAGSADAHALAVNDRAVSTDEIEAYNINFTGKQLGKNEIDAFVDKYVVFKAYNPSGCIVVNFAPATLKSVADAFEAYNSDMFATEIERYMTAAADTGDSDFVTTIANKFYAAQKFAMAIKYYEKLNTTQWDLNIRMGHCYMNLDKVLHKDKIIQCYNNIIVEKPINNIFFGDFLKENGEYHDAILRYKSALVMRSLPTSQVAESMEGIIDSYLKLCDYESAAKCLFLLYKNGFHRTTITTKNEGLVGDYGFNKAEKWEDDYSRGNKQLYEFILNNGSINASIFMLKKHSRLKRSNVLSLFLMWILFPKCVTIETLLITF